MKKPITFGIDIDETIASTFLDGKILSRYHEKTGQKIPLSSVTDYYFESTPWLDVIYDDYLDEFHDRLPLFENAKKILENLKKSGVRLIIITSREQKHQAGTLRFIKEVFGENFFEKILFTSDFAEDNKATIAKNENCDIVIDDALHHIERYLAETDMIVIKMRSSWNLKKFDSERLIEVDNWNEVWDFFEKIL